MKSQPVAEREDWEVLSGRTEPRDPAEAQRMTVVQLRTVIKSTPKNAYTGVVGASLMAFVAWHGVDAGVLPSSIRPLIWWVLIVIALLLHAFVAYRHNGGNRTSAQTLRAGAALNWTVTYCGVAWGSLAWLLLPAANVATEAFLMIAAAMVFMGGAVAQAIFRPQLHRFLFSATAVFVLGLLRLGGLFHVLMAAAILLLMFVILSAARTQEDAVRAATLAGFETQVLLAERIQQQVATDRARAEAEAAREQAEIANQGKTKFLAAAGHDLRQPMHAIVQYFGHLRRKNNDLQLDETITRIGKSMDAMQDLLDTVLEVSKLMTGAIKASLRTFKASDVLDRLDIQMRPIAEDKGLTFEVATDDCYLHSDRVLLERILRNLVLNAIRYTQKGGIVVRARCKGPRVLLQVFDSGIGIARSERARIFEAFYQVGNVARDRRKGLGLGLAIVQQMAALLSLEVRLVSKEGKGSVFTVVAARAEPVMSALCVSPQVQRASFTKGALVLVIDDDLESLEATAATLSDFGCQVVTANSGRHAIERLKTHDCVPHLIISDYRLEGETGLEAIHAVKDSQRASLGDDFVIPALLVSGDTAPSELKSVQEAGLVMLHKPVRPEAMYEAVNAELEWLASGRTIADRI